MKIWCDVCDKEEALVFCCADEAALCHGCDLHVHFANKLAGKHLRFSLISPSLHLSPLCDLCRERRALLFCQEDRAILCRECDIPIHKANEHTQKHHRFLLTGLKLSASPITSDQARRTTSSTSSTSNGYNRFEERNSNSNSHQMSDSGCTGSISEYFMETLPSWRVEDLLEQSSSVSSDINKGSFL